jgi:hypothetical protein
MKTEINNENKAKFFALYWGQNVLFDHQANLGPYPINNSRNWSHEAHQLYLKPLSKISDEEMQCLAQIEGYGQEESYFGKVIRNENMAYLEIIEDDEFDMISRFQVFMKSGFIEYNNMQSYEDNRTCGITTSSYDFLRSKGYALPYLGLSVDEMIEAGWIKSTES